MTLKQLNYVVTVAEVKNITEAAKRLFIAQPSLTSAIREIENEFDITIFTRSNKGIEITTEGDEFLGYAKMIGVNSQQHLKHLGRIRGQCYSK
jgi:DNA-binding transcriptional LysR family regulator